MMNLNKAVELTQRRKGAETQGFRLLGRGLNAKTQRRSPAEPEIRSPQGGGRSSFASGDSFRAAHLTAETRRAQRRKPSPASFLCALRVSAVKFLAREFFAAWKQLRLLQCRETQRRRTLCESLRIFAPLRLCVRFRFGSPLRLCLLLNEGVRA